MCKNKHLSLDQRILIQSQLDQGSSFKKIALLIGKDCTTISKEVRKHIRKEKSGAAGRAFNDCLLCYQHSCSIRSLCSRCSSRSKRLCWACGKCMDTCTSYTPFVCPSLKKPPYVCNACSIRSRCSLEKSFYRASFAQKQYDTLKAESRSGFALSEEEVSHLDSVVSPLLRNGQSIHHIAVHHKDETMVSERTLYTYVNNGLFSARNIDMPRTVRMRPRKRKKTGIKVDKTCRIGRSFQDYQTFLQDHPSLPVRQIDSLEGIRGGPVLLTIHFVQQELQPMIPALSSTSSIGSISYLDPIPSRVSSRYSLLIMAANSQTLERSNMIPMETSGPICFIVIPMLLIKKVIVRTIMR